MSNKLKENPVKSKKYGPGKGPGAKMLKVRYYRSDEQLGRDLLAMSPPPKKKFGFSDIKGPRLGKRASKVLNRLAWTKRKGRKLLFLQKTSGRLPSQIDIVLMAIFLRTQFEKIMQGGSISSSQGLSGFNRHFEGTVFEKLEVLKLITGNAFLVRNGILSKRGLKKDILDALLGLESKKTAGTRPKTFNCPPQIKKELDKLVIGQERAKRLLSRAAYNYIRSLGEGSTHNFPNVLMVGPTGSGKTHIIRSLAGILKVPFVITDATQYSETGYVGGSVLDMLYELQKKSTQPDEGGIIYIDEIDKLAGEVKLKREVSARAVQEELLNLLDGKRVSGKVYTGSGFSQYGYVDTDTSKILFVCGGSFSGLSGEETASCGFTAQVREEKRAKSTEDFMNYGMIPELLGRLPVKIFFAELSVEELVEIMKNPRVSPVEKYRGLLPPGMEVPQEDIRNIAERAAGMGLGARGLVAALEEYINDRERETGWESFSPPRPESG